MGLPVPDLMVLAFEALSGLGPWLAGLGIELGL